MVMYTGLTFRKTGGRTRLYFLSEPASKRDTSLFYTDLPPPASQTHSNPQWCPLIESGFQVNYISSFLISDLTLVSKGKEKTWKNMEIFS